MESLKKFEEILQKDPRHDCFAVFDLENGGHRKLTLNDLYGQAEEIRLHNGVPEEIRTHFETARNLVIYSWFYYPFNVTAELCAYTSVEYALKIKSGASKTRRSFKELLRTAVEQKWICDEGFSYIRNRKERIRKYQESLPPEFRTPEISLADEYCQNMVKCLPSLRNGLAHGTTFLHNHGASTVRICAELINQLFPNPENTSSQ